MKFLFSLPQNRYDDSVWHAFGLARTLLDHGHDVRIALGENSPLAPVAAQHGLEVESFLSQGRGLLGRIRQIKGFKQLAKTFAPDFMFCYGKLPAGWRNLGQVEPIGVVWSAKSRVSHIHKFWRVIATCDAIRNRLIERYRLSAVRVHTLHGAAPVLSGSDTSLRTEIRKKFGVQENNILIGILGPVNADSGHELLMQALSKDYHPNLKLLALVEDEAEIAVFKQMARRYNISSVAHAQLYSEACQSCLKALDVGVEADLIPQGIARRAIELITAGVPVVAASPGADSEVCNPQNRFESKVAVALMDRIISHGPNLEPFSPSRLYGELMLLLSETERVAG